MNAIRLKTKNVLSQGDKKMKTIKLLAMILITVTLVFISAEPVMAGKDHIKIGTVDALKTMNPYQASSRDSLMLSYMIFDPLVERDVKSGKIKPHLVTSWKLINDKTWEFKLRPGIKFHSGNPLNAEAVRYTIMERILNPDQKSPHLTGWNWCVDVEVVDDLTFRIKSKKSYPLVLQRMNILFPMDPVWTKDMVASHGEAYLSQHSNGTGPFKLAKFEEGKKIELVKNNNYWKKGVPSYNKLTLRFIKEASTRLAELISGGIDDAMELPPDLVGMVKKYPDLMVRETPILRIYFWQFDSMGRAEGTPPALKDSRVRRAIWHAIDRKAIVKNVLGGHASNLDIPLNPMQFGAVTDMVTPQYDPIKAKELLKEAGYADGFTMTIWNVAGDYQMASEATSSYLEKVGIKLKFKNYSGRWGEFSKLNKAGKTDGVMGFGWGSYNIFDPDALWPYFFMIPEGSYNYTNDQELSDWLHQAREIMDIEKRKILYRKAQERIVNEVYWMPFYIRHALNATNKHFHYEMGTDQVPRWQYGTWK